MEQSKKYANRFRLYYLLTLMGLCCYDSYISVYLEQYLHMSGTQIGCFIAVSMVAGLVIMPLYGSLGDKTGLVRYGSSLLPMDETLALCAVDLGGRPYFVYDAAFAAPACGGMDTQMAREFFYAVSYTAAMNLHLKVLYGANDHHKLEALFKAFGRALDAATRRITIEGVTL